MDSVRVSRVVPGRMVAAVVGVTVLLTLSMVGVVALVSARPTGANGRVPFYVLLTATAFVASLWKLDRDEVDGTTVLIASSGLAIGCGVLVSLAVEGTLFGVTNPDRIVGSHLLVYFAAAGMICTGLGMWGLRHWREFTVHEKTG